jgi:methenyltetrahydromethanopterin cyclohydrolase
MPKEYTIPLLNDTALSACDRFAAQADRLGIQVNKLDCGTRILDFGVNAPGSVDAGIALATICISQRGLISLEPASSDVPAAQEVHVNTRDPVVACMASQYAGWEIKGEKFFAMGSGPMRAAYANEELFKLWKYRERPQGCVGVLETSKIPPDNVCIDIATKCNIEPRQLTLCVARTASIAGTIQIVARSVETALHKLHVLGFDIRKVNRASGHAPLPPVAENDLQAIGWTNDAILYGGGVLLDMVCEDAQLEALGPKVPSDASPDHGRPFAEIFARYNNDFYRIDPQLFSPAVVILHNSKTGTTFKYGNLEYGILAESFASAKK